MKITPCLRKLLFEEAETTSIDIEPTPVNLPEDVESSPDVEESTPSENLCWKIPTWDGGFYGTILPKNIIGRYEGKNKVKVYVIVLEGSLYPVILSGTNRLLPRLINAIAPFFGITGLKTHEVGWKHTTDYAVRKTIVRVPSIRLTLLHERSSGIKRDDVLKIFLFSIIVRIKISSHYIFVDRNEIYLFKYFIANEGEINYKMIEPYFDDIDLSRSMRKFILHTNILSNRRKKKQLRKCILSFGKDLHYYYTQIISTMSSY